MEPRKIDRLLEKYHVSAEDKLVHQQQEQSTNPNKRKQTKRKRGRRKAEKTTDGKKTIARLFTYLKNDTWKIVLALVCSIVGATMNLIGMYMLRPVINRLEKDFINYKRSGFSSEVVAVGIKALVSGIGVLLAIYLIGVICGYVQQRIMVFVSQRAMEKLRNDLYEKIQTLPIRFYDTHSHGELMSRFTNDVDTVQELLGNTIIQLIAGAISIIGSFILMVYTNVWLTILTVLIVPVLIKAGQMVANNSKKYFAMQQESLGAVNGYIEESVTGQKVIKVFCHEEVCEEEFGLLADYLKEKQIKAQFYGGIMAPVLGNLSQISYAITACVGGVFCITRNFDVGGLAIFVNFSRQFARPINEVAMQVNTIFSALAGARRVFSIMDEEPEVEDVKDAVELKAIQGKVELSHVTFGYERDKKILKDISLYAKPGQKIAFVGSTGAGKTTITNLINRFYDIDEGIIMVDGIDIKKIKKDNLRNNISMVLQETHLFSGTVMENIRYGRLDATDQEVIEAAKIANAHSFIQRLEQGYDTILEGDGVNLSQGQRQLLNIARAAISKAPILILDEATSSVDTRTEKHIEMGMAALMKNRTTFVIAHRLSTVRDADAIMVLEHGTIMERGSHEDLIKLKGRYYNLYTGVTELE